MYDINSYAFHIDQNNYCSNYFSDVPIKNYRIMTNKTNLHTWIVIIYLL